MMRVMMAATALLALAAGAAPGMAARTPARIAGRMPAPTPAAQRDEPLPDGPGRKILQASCTQCHDLKEVTKFRGYYTKVEWRDVVVTMIQYGAKVEDKDVEVLVDYLAVNLGKPSAPVP